MSAATLMHVHAFATVGTSGAQACKCGLKRPPLSANQLDVLDAVHVGGQLAEGWVSYSALRPGHGEFLMRQFDRIVESLEKRGLLGPDECGDTNVTDEGRAALRAAGKIR